MTWKDNIIKWDESPKGYYEVWFIIFHNPISRDGFWIRYTLMSPRNFITPPTGALWFSYFNSSDRNRNIGIKMTHPREKITFKRDEFYIEIGDGKLEKDGAIGEIRKDNFKISWNLKFGDNEKETHQHIPDLIRKLKLSSSIYCSPNLTFKINGNISINGTNIELVNAPGTQAHIFGKKYGAGWAWGHCDLFENNKNAVIELLSSKLKENGRLLSAFYIKTENHEFKLNSITDFFKNESIYDINSWKFEGQRGKYKVQGQISVDEKDLIGVEYVGPRGKHLYCYNSELASCEIQILKKQDNQWKIEDNLLSNKTTAFETSHPEPKKGLEIRIPW